jgi:hypothetical protein
LISKIAVEVSAWLIAVVLVIAARVSHRAAPLIALVPLLLIVEIVAVVAAVMVAESILPS